MEEQEAVDKILATLEKAEDQPDQQPAAETPSEEVEQQITETEEVEAVEQAEPAIEPPPTWKAELKARWKDIPSDLQREFAQWETERNQGVNSKLNESAEARKAADAEKQALAQERQRYAEQTNAAIQQVLALDPVLSFWAKQTPDDRSKLARENPGDYTALKEQVESRVATIQSWQANRQRALEEHVRQVYANAETVLAEKIPDWKDEAKRKELVTSLRTTAEKDYGFRPEELAGVVDPRHVAVLRDAMLYRQMMAAQKTAQEKRVTPKTPQVVKPVPAQDGQRQESQRVKALKQRAIRSDKTSDQVAAVLAAIGER